jgi:flavin reductase (DIM6/NTAB) family NADH-FMN oxidoreductase RutF
MAVMETTRELPAAVDQSEFRYIMSRFASGVTVVTVQHEGMYHGSTVASFCSLSLDPPLVLVCIGQRSTTHSLIKDAAVFGVNILGEDGEHLSQHFASRNPDKFSGVAYHIGQSGVPLLEQAVATLECRLVNQYPGGDHTIFIGEVVDAHARDNVSPLVYFNRGYHGLR